MSEKRKMGTLQTIHINDISPNPHNPRLFFDDEEMNELMKSIAEVGVLVPVTVYFSNKSKTNYTLLDGERRWRCAKKLGLKSINANVIDEPKDVVQNILFMFNIHHYRKEWELFPTALKLEAVMKELGTKNESVIANFTGVKRSMIRRCLVLLWYPEKYRDILYKRDGVISTDFFIELYPIAKKLSEEKEYETTKKLSLFIDASIKKFLAKDRILDVKEFRIMRKAMAVFERKNKFHEFKNKINEFITNDKTMLEIFEVEEFEEDRAIKNVLKYLNYINSNLTNIDPNLLSDYFVVEQLKELRKKLNYIIDEIE